MKRDMFDDGDNKRYPRVLVISHNVFSETSSMGKTLYQFFKGWPKDRLAQLYLHTEVPTTRVCERYFRITDFDVLRSLKSRGAPGRAFKGDDIREDLVSERVDAGREAALYQWGRDRKPYMYLGRNLLWRLGNWYSQKLRAWIKEFGPEVIFFASGDYSFSYRIAVKVAGEFHIPLATYVCDDYYFCRRPSLSPLYYLYRWQYRRAFRNIVQRSAAFVFICDQMREDYRRLGADGITLMTPSSLERSVQPKDHPVPVASYVGSLGYNRWKALAQVGRALRQIDPRQAVHIYTMDAKLAQNLDPETDGVVLHGGVDARQAEQILRSSDLVLHVESMDKLTRRKVRYSVSTKVADALASGSCLFAYGPGEIASMRYLIENKAACTVTCEEELRPALKEILTFKEKRLEFTRRALELSKRRHDAGENRLRLRELLDGVSRAENAAGRSPAD